MCGEKCPEYPKNAVFECLVNKNLKDRSAVIMSRNRIPVSTYVNFGKFRGYTAGVKVAGIEDERGGDIEAISCRWITSSDYRRMFVCFFKNDRILLKNVSRKNTNT